MPKFVEPHLYVFFSSLRYGFDFHHGMATVILEYTNYNTVFILILTVQDRIAWIEEPRS